MSIPKRIFYFWFGKGEKTDLNKKCLTSWKKYCPDYEIIEINESNFDVNNYEYTKHFYEHKAWAFVTDFARCVTLDEYGGIALDLDIELKQPINELLDCDAFFCAYHRWFFELGAMGSKKGIPEILKKAISETDYKSPMCHAGKNLNRLLWQKFNIVGNSITEHSNIKLYNHEFISDVNVKQEGKLGTHYSEKTWINGYVGKFKELDDMLSVNVVCSGKMIENKNSDITIYLKAEKVEELQGGDGIRGLTNLLMNPSVAKVCGDGFEIARAGKSKRINSDFLEIENGYARVYLYEI